MKRYLLAAGLVLGALPAQAQIGGGGVQGLTYNPLNVQGLSVNPVLGTTNRGFNEIQVGAGTYSGGSAVLNSFAINADTIDAGANFVIGWQFLQQFGGTAAVGGRVGGVFYSIQLAPTSSSNTNRNYEAAQFTTIAMTGDGGTNLSGGAKGASFGYGVVATSCGGATDLDDLCRGLTPAATNLLELSGAEINVSGHTGSSMVYKSGISIVALNTDKIQGATYDCALCISTQSGSGSPIGWKDGILFGPMNGVHPLASTGALMATVGSSTVATGIDFSSYTITGNLLAGPGGFSIGGSGQNLIIGSSATGAIDVELGSLTTVAVSLIDFHSSGNNIDYDFRLIASGGTNSVGHGLMTYQGDVLDLSALLTGVRVKTAANTSVATVLGSVGPAGSNTTVQEWFVVYNSAGTARYIPAF